MKIQKITPDILYLTPDSMRKLGACAGVVAHGKKATIGIDLNLGPTDSLDALRQFNPDLALITHYHLDHSIWIRRAEKTCQAKVLVPEAEAQYLSSLDYVLDRTAGKFNLTREWEDFIVNTLGFTPLETFETLTSETGLDRYRDGLTPIPTPGHSPGHFSFYFSKEKILFSGDMGLDRFGPWYGWPDCDLEGIVQSIDRLSRLDLDLILTSHGGVINKEDIPGAWQSSLFSLLKRERRILDQMDAGLSQEEILKNGVFYPVTSTAPPPMVRFLEMWDKTMLDHHLKVIRQGGLQHLFPDIWPME